MIASVLPRAEGRNFRVFEDKNEQKLAVFKREDVPVSMGLIIDNSGSMRDKRPRVNEAALTLVQASNPQDEAFVVNFNDDSISTSIRISQIAFRN